MIYPCSGRSRSTRRRSPSPLAHPDKVGAGLTGHFLGAVQHASNRFSASCFYLPARSSPSTENYERGTETAGRDRPRPKHGPNEVLEEEDPREYESLRSMANLKA